MRLLTTAFVLLAFSCSPKQDRIVIPVVNSNFYNEALERIDNDLDRDEGNLKLVQQKLYYCDLLDWPATCLTALDELKRRKGMTPQLLDQYVIYYERHSQYLKLLEVIDRWSPEFDLEEKYQKQKILSLIRSPGKTESIPYLQSYMISRNSTEDIAFAAGCYLELKDTVWSIYYLSKLSELEESHTLVLNKYPYMLFALGHEDRAFGFFEKKARVIPTDYTFHSDLAFRYEASGLLDKSRNKLKNFTHIDSVVYRIADLYLQEEQWDSAHQFIDQLIERDSLDRDAWFKKARMYEDRGWLSYSLNYYDHVTYLNPNDSIALERAETVRRKIAYLQRLKFEENQLPLPILESKKIINNE